MGDGQYKLKDVGGTPALFLLNSDGTWRLEASPTIQALVDDDDDCEDYDLRCLTPDILSELEEILGDGSPPGGPVGENDPPTVGDEDECCCEPDGGACPTQEECANCASTVEVNVGTSSYSYDVDCNGFGGTLTITFGSWSHIFGCGNCVCGPEPGCPSLVADVASQVFFDDFSQDGGFVCDGGIPDFGGVPNGSFPVGSRYCTGAILCSTSADPDNPSATVAARYVFAGQFTMANPACVYFFSDQICGGVPPVVAPCANGAFNFFFEAPPLVAGSPCPEDYSYSAVALNYTGPCSRINIQDVVDVTFPTLSIA